MQTLHQHVAQEIVMKKQLQSMPVRFHINKRGKFVLQVPLKRSTLNYQQKMKKFKKPLKLNNARKKRQIATECVAVATLLWK